MPRPHPVALLAPAIRLRAFHSTPARFFSDGPGEDFLHEMRKAKERAKERANVELLRRLEEERIKAERTNRIAAYKTQGVELLATAWDRLTGKSEQAIRDARRERAKRAEEKRKRREDPIWQEEHRKRREEAAKEEEEAAKKREEREREEQLRRDAEGKEKQERKNREKQLREEQRRRDVEEKEKEERRKERKREADKKKWREHLQRTGDMVQSATREVDSLVQDVRLARKRLENAEVRIEQEARAERAKLRRNAEEWKQACAQMRDSITQSQHLKEMANFYRTRAQRCADPAAFIEQLEFWTATRRRWNLNSNEIGSAVHDANVILQWTQMADDELDPEHASKIVQIQDMLEFLVEDMDNESDLIKQYGNEARTAKKEAPDAAAARRAEMWGKEVGWLLEQWGCVKLLVIELQQDMKRAEERMKLAHKFNCADDGRLRHFFIMYRIEEVGKSITNANKDLTSVRDWYKEQAFPRGDRAMLEKRKRMELALRAYPSYWQREVRHAHMIPLSNTIKRENELNPTLFSRHRDVFRHYIYQQLELLWKPRTIFDYVNPRRLGVAKILFLIRSDPARYLDQGVQALRTLLADETILSQGNDAVARLRAKRIAGHLKRALRNRRERRKMQAPVEPKQETEAESKQEAEEAVTPERPPKVDSRPAWLKEASLWSPPTYLLEKELLKQFPLFPYRAYQRNASHPPESYHTSRDACSAAIRALRGKIIGFDMEWNRTATPDAGLSANAPLIMLATNSAIHVLHLSMFHGIPKELVLLLESPDVIKAATDADEKCRRLRSFLHINPRGFKDLGAMHYLLREKTLQRRISRKVQQRLSLTQLTPEYLGFPMPPSSFVSLPLPLAIKSHVPSLANRAFAHWAVGNTLYERLHQEETEARSGLLPVQPKPDLKDARRLPPHRKPGLKKDARRLPPYREQDSEKDAGRLPPHPKPDSEKDAGRLPARHLKPSPDVPVEKRTPPSPEKVARRDEKAETPLFRSVFQRKEEARAPPSKRVSQRKDEARAPLLEGVSLHKEEAEPPPNRPYRRVMALPSERMPRWGRLARRGEKAETPLFRKVSRHEEEAGAPPSNRASQRKEEARTPPSKRASQRKEEARAPPSKIVARRDQKAEAPLLEVVSLHKEEAKAPPHRPYRRVMAGMARWGKKPEMPLFRTVSQRKEEVRAPPSKRVSQRKEEARAPPVRRVAQRKEEARAPPFKRASQRKEESGAPRFKRSGLRGRKTRERDQDMPDLLSDDDDEIDGFYQSMIDVNHDASDGGE